MDNQTVEDLCAEIAQKRTERLSKDLLPRPKNNATASDLHDCTRAMVYAVTNWKDRPAFSPELIARFERGSAIEEVARRELRDLGYSIKEERQPFEIRDKHGRLLVRGIVDGFLVKGRQDWPLEVKSLHPNVYHRIQTQDDFDRSIWSRKYPKQLLTYMYHYNREEGFFLLDDCLGHWKLLPVRLNYEKMEAVLKQLEAVAIHLEEKTQPDFHSDPSVCTRCDWFKRVCFPPWSAGEGLSVIEAGELEAKISRRAALDEAATEYDALDKDIKATFKAIGIKADHDYLIGDYIITAKEVVRNMKATEARQQKFLTYSIDSINQAGKGEG
jgi:CRISPR/Cas system-associated exonuclease Cas4 (RecB family)